MTISQVERAYRADLLAFGLKRCGDCEEIKPREDFGQFSRYWDGLSTYCRDCEGVRAASRYTRTRAVRRLQMSDWKSRNREAVRDHAAIRRARAKVSEVEPVERLVVWARDHGICHICELPADPSDWHLDHVVPLSRGGAHTYGNTAVSHPKCNQAKGSKPWPSMRGDHRGR